MSAMGKHHELNAMMREAATLVREAEAERKSISANHVYAWSVGVLRWQVMNVIKHIELWALSATVGSIQHAEYNENLTRGNMEIVRYDSGELRRAVETGDYESLLGQGEHGVKHSLSFDLPHQKEDTDLPKCSRRS